MKEKLKGAQMSFFEDRAYGVACEGFELILCDMHVDLYRIIMGTRDVKYTGKAYPLAACEHCEATRKEISKCVIAETSRPS